MPTDRELAYAYAAGRNMRAANKERAPPLYAMGEHGTQLRRQWETGWDAEDEHIKATQRAGHANATNGAGKQ